ncbi:MAG: HAMP domain-containing sensor histidine kinase [Acidobacteriota bacterium]
MPRSRTVIAALLVTVTVAFPCAAWFFAGSYRARQEARRLVYEAQVGTRETIARLAIRVNEELEKLRDSETSRPFYHYQNLYHDPQGASQGPAVVRSPLAQGPGNPLVSAYFQIDPKKRISLPTLNEEVPALCAKSCEQLQRAIKSGLTCAKGTCSAPKLAAFADDRTALQPDHVEVLEFSAWRQNLLARELYAGMRPGGRGVPEAIQSKGAGNVLIQVGSFQWITVPMGGVDRLMAVRRVDTPIGRFVQGFVVDGGQIDKLLATATPEAQFLTSRTVQDSSALPAGDTGWNVALDNRAATRSAVQRGRDLYLQFLRMFWVTVGLVSLAGFGVVMVVRQADRLASQRSQFAAAAAHELRTPLAGLQMYGEMLAEGLGDPQRHKEYARRIAAEAERLGRVVSNVNHFSRLERGNLSLNPQPGDLADAVVQCVERQRPALEAAGAELQLAIDSEVPPARFDRDAVGHIVQNLLDNAEKYTRAAASRTIRVALQAEGDAVVLQVADQGPGIAAQLRRTLFEPFTRGKDPNAPAGLGLGLALTRALARAQGGDVTLANHDGPGADFRVTFPAAAASGLG